MMKHSFPARLFAALTALLLFAGCCTYAAAETVTIAYVNNPDSRDRLHLRAQPDQSAASLGKYYSGTPVTVLEAVNEEWTQVQIGSLRGYAMTRHLISDPAAVTYALPFYYSTSSAWEVYTEPSADSEYSMHGYGETVELLGFTDQWWHILVGNDTGFVPAAPGCLSQISGHYTAGLPTAEVYNPVPAHRLNLRSEPTEQSPTLGKYYNGCAVVVLEARQDDWCRVRIGDTEGYMNGAYLTFDASLSCLAWELPRASVQTADGFGTQLLKAPSSDAYVLDLYADGTEVQVLGVTENWCHVQRGNSTGYLRTEHLEPQLSFAAPVETSVTADWPLVINEYTATVNNPNPADRLHLRNAPNRDALSLGRYYNGVRVIINGDIADEWLEVSIGSLQGYMQTQYLMTSGEAVPSAMPLLHVAVPSGELHLRKKQSRDSLSLGKYPDGTEVILMGFSGEWAHVIVDGQTGFMLMEYLK